MIAVDWGTTHARAWALDAQGHVLAQRQTDDGVGAVPPGGFAAAFARLSDGLAPGAPVVMAGMVGSRNGWREAPYAPAPCGAQEIARAFVSVEAQGRALHIAPGVDWRDAGGVYDVMRGEEVKCLGADIADGVLCLPGTHCKWVEMRAGRIARFATFATRRGSVVPENTSSVELS